MLDVARAYYNARSEETSRFWYLSGSFGATLPALLIGALTWIFRDSIENAFGENSVLFILSCVMGALGALLSVIWRSGKLQFDCAAGKPLHYLEASSRISAGAISGLLVGLAVKYQIFLGPFTEEGREAGIMLIAALASGTSERFATSIISTFQAKNGSSGESAAKE